MIRIPFDLSAHCVQTEIKRLYNRQLSACIKSQKKIDQAEEKLELLKKALETWDFSTLRAEHRALAGGRDNKVALIADDDGRISIVIDDQTIFL